MFASEIKAGMHFTHDGGTTYIAQKLPKVRACSNNGTHVIVSIKGQKETNLVTLCFTPCTEVFQRFGR